MDFVSRVSNFFFLSRIRELCVLCGRKRPERPKAISPGQRPREEDEPMIALTGQKLYRCYNAFAPAGRNLLRYLPFTQGVALGWYLVGLAGRLCTKSIRTRRNFSNNTSHWYQRFNLGVP